MFKILFLLINIFTLFEIEAFSWNEVRERGLEEGKKYNISSGTGFYISENYIVTSEHVVQDCLNISVRGAVEPTAAYLYAKDASLDLALLKTDKKSRSFAIISENSENLSAGDEVTIIGYPLESSDSGEYRYNNAFIESIIKEKTEVKEIEFSFAVNYGNSGGPVIDSSGNVIGLVQARKSYYLNQNKKLSLVNNIVVEEDSPFKVTGVAVGYGKLKKFFSDNHIYYTAHQSYKNFRNYNPQSIAKKYLVNIHCVRNINTSQNKK